MNGKHILATASILVLPLTQVRAHRIALSPPFSTAQTLEDELKAAGEDIEALCRLHARCEDQQRTADARRVAKRILELDSEHVQAREALGHVRYAERWFTSRSAMAKFRRDEARSMLSEHGKVRVGERWVLVEEAPFVRMGWTRSESDGTFRSPGEHARAARDARLRESGHRRQDQLWIPPEEFASLDAGLWKCGEDWLELSEANRLHSSFDWPWETISPSGRFSIVSTCPRAVVDRARVWADETAADLERLFGVSPERELIVIVLSSLESYNQLAKGGDAFPSPESSGWSSLHSAFFADRFCNADPARMEYMGCGITYYSGATEADARLGEMSVRHAAALSWLDGIDPSWEAVSYLLTGDEQGSGRFWQEKRLPLWLRFGAASFIERFRLGAGGPAAASYAEWSLAELRECGGLRPLREVLEYQLDAERKEDGRRWLLEAGAVVFYLAQTPPPMLRQAHAELRKALAAGASVREAVASVEARLLASEADLRAVLELPLEESDRGASDETADR